jgi:hypothetical protein
MRKDTTGRPPRRARSNTGRFKSVLGEAQKIADRSSGLAVNAFGRSVSANSHQRPLTYEKADGTTGRFAVWGSSWTGEWGYPWRRTT